jgi:uncharacterized DUF497 family protein
LLEPDQAWRVIRDRTAGVLDPRRVIVEDFGHGDREQRYFCFGRVADGVMTVRFTWRAPRIRIIGAGYWRKGRKVYEQESG